jgi:hypothetical protein
MQLVDKLSIVANSSAAPSDTQPDHGPLKQTDYPQGLFWDRCIAVKSSGLQGIFVCFDKKVGWCVGIAVILVVGRER